MWLCAQNIRNSICWASGGVVLKAAASCMTDMWFAFWTHWLEKHTGCGYTRKPVCPKPQKEKWRWDCYVAIPQEGSFSLTSLSLYIEHTCPLGNLKGKKKGRNSICTVRGRSGGQDKEVRCNAYGTDTVRLAYFWEFSVSRARECFLFQKTKKNKSKEV